MTSQPPLLEGSDTPMLPGPQFTPRPGWGGQLKRWFSHNAYSIVFRFVLLCALVLIARSLWVNFPSGDTSHTPTPGASATPSEFRGLTVTAAPGDGMTDLAARALDLYIAVQSRVIRLDAAQHLFAVDSLARAVCWCPLEVGQDVSFTSQNLESTVTAALDLTPAQEAAWARYLQ